MRGFLKSREGIFQLAVETTTVGHEGCDLVVSADYGDCIRAVIKYLDSDSSFTLYDVDSVLGIYVNDCRIQNTAVKLEPNDLIRFGYNGIPYEFLLECQPKISDYQGSSYIMQHPAIGTITGIGDGAGWVSGARKEEKDECNLATVTKYDSDKTSTDLEGQIEQLIQEVRRLSQFEHGCTQKDELIEQLREEVTNLQNFVRHIEVDRCPMCKQNESRFGSTINSGGNMLTTSCIQASDFQPFATEAGKQSATIELVCQMQRSMTSKDDTISRLAAELANAKKELLNSDCQNKALESHILQNSSGLVNGDCIAKDREIALLRLKEKRNENRKADLTSQITSLNDDLSKLKVATENEKSSGRKLRSEVEILKVKNQDLERAERATRVDVEQLTRRLEKLRSRAVQTVMAGTNTKTSDKLITDDELLTLLKKCADERVDLLKKVHADDTSATADKKAPDVTRKTKAT